MSELRENRPVMKNNMSETLSVELVLQGVGEELFSNHQAQSTPFLNLSQEETIIQNAHTEKIWRHFIFITLSFALFFGKTLAQLFKNCHVVALFFKCRWNCNFRWNTHYIHNKTIIGLGFHISPRYIKALVPVVRLTLPQITELRPW